ncbi:hypothetical protein JX265_000512 [Neoarthrinium moseri]|uniref:Uncharacterized protein n=1 Tax=Neoarthrinium moseri TaxID=1658444 RepID=A0A9Q0AVN2_9PEZI|nr:uncharacterized protein JN550_001737 [Neoarthrinium moseri]KAI1876241.1 hypothetical protein JN550_001737 [Neoarthrinium moseri]KAI1881686.1 hypothetical protein JX265_000512 [Neoarthrinium moseri]
MAGLPESLASPRCYCTYPRGTYYGTILSCCHTVGNEQLPIPRGAKQRSMQHGRLQPRDAARQRSIRRFAMHSDRHHLSSTHREDDEDACWGTHEDQRRILCTWTSQKRLAGYENGAQPLYRVRCLTAVPLIDRKLPRTDYFLHGGTKTQ